MAVKSVLDIEVNDQAFQAFTKNWNKYNAELAKQPERWAGVGSEFLKVDKATRALLSAQLAQGAAINKLLEGQRSSQTVAVRSAQTWLDIERRTKSAAAHVADLTRSLLKWGTLTGLFSGLLGAGGLFGIERFATSAGGLRRESLGLGLTAGERQAFGVNFGRLVEPGNFLGSVSTALHDVTQRVGLYAAGLSESDLRGRDTGQVAAALLPHLKAIVDATPPAELAQVLRARRLDQFLSLSDAQRLRATSPAELAQLERRYASDRGRLGVGDSTLRGWQDLNQQLQRAGAQIETVLIKGLAPLTPEVQQLSGALADAIGRWVKDLTPVLERFARYLASPKFERDAETFAAALDRLATGAGNLLKSLGMTAPPAATAATVNQPSSAPSAPPPLSWWNSLGYLFHGRAPVNNPGNLRVPGSEVEFQQFATPAAGLRAMSAQLLRDQNVHGQTTLRQLIYGNAGWAGWTTTDRAAYLAALTSGMGLRADDPMNLNDVGQRGKLMSLMTRQEGYGNRYPAGVIVQVLNNTGGSANVIASQLPQ